MTDDEDEKPLRTLQDLNVDDGLIESVKFDPLCLEEEFVRCAPDTAFWNTRYADAERDCALAELHKKREEARLQLYYRTKLEGTKYTEAVITSQVELDDAMYDAKVAYIEAEAWRVKVKGWCSALAVKRDMLIQQGAHVREEMKGDPVLRAQAAGARALNGTRQR